jgi:hypothetical protein
LGILEDENAEGFGGLGWMGLHGTKISNWGLRRGHCATEDER